MDKESNKSRPFYHQPLPDPARYIRLLEITHLDPFAPIQIHCRLTFRRLHTAPRYHAISYTWGDPSATTVILLNGRRMRIRANCAAVLAQAKRHGKARFYWCDALCIDQANDSEKGHQVAMMGTVYRRAACVLACVGAHGEGSRDLFADMDRHGELLRKIASSATDEGYGEKQRKTPLWAHLAREWAEAEHAVPLEALRCAFGAFLARPYFSRTWVYQEVVLGRQPVVCCGWRDYIPMHTIYGLFCAAKYLDHTNYQQVSLGGARLLRAGSFSLCRLERESLHKLLRDVLPLQCADPRDKVYSILSIVRWGPSRPPIEPDYTRPALRLAVEVVEQEMMADSFRERRADFLGQHLRVLSLNLLLRQDPESSGLALAMLLRRIRRWRELSRWQQHQLNRAYRYMLVNNDGDGRKMILPFRGAKLGQRDGQWYVCRRQSRQQMTIRKWPFKPDLEECPQTAGEFLEKEDSILLPRRARAGDWCLITAEPTRHDEWMVLIVRQEKIVRPEGPVFKYAVVAKGLVKRGRFLRSLRHWEPWDVFFDLEDLVVLFNAADVDKPDLDQLQDVEVDEYMETAVCWEWEERRYSSFARRW